MPACVRRSLCHPSPTELGSGLGCALSHVDIGLKKLAWTDGVPAFDDPKALAFILAATGRIDSTSFGPQAPTNLYAVT